MATGARPSRETRIEDSSWPRPRALDGREQGLFGSDSLSWRIGREHVLGALGGGRALILQVAHPLVAAGVAEHSDYRERPWKRLFGTLDTVTTIVFGTAEEAEAAARRIWALHGRVRGELGEDAGKHSSGTPYDARDPALALWVHATLVDSALLVYDRYVERLTLAEREAYYEESKLFAEMFGVPRERQPETYADFNAYFERVVDEELAVTDSLLDVVDATLVRPALPGPLAILSRPVAAAYRLHTAGLLPERLRRELGLGWGPRRERLARSTSSVARALLPRLPGVMRDFPRARDAERRLATARG